jgi:Trypsin
MIPRSCLPIVLGALLGASGCGPSAVGEAASAVTGGAPDPGDPAVAALYLDRSHTAFCTGTLIAPRVVLTAAHCLDSEGYPWIHREVFFGSDVEEAGEVIAVDAAVVHPGHEPDSAAHDIALLVLDEPASASPVPLVVAGAPPLAPPEALRVVGFGITVYDASTGGEKRTGQAALAVVSALDLEGAPDPSQPCAGDSGGPVLVRDGDVERLAGVVSRGDEQCEDHFFAARVDDPDDHDFIASNLAAVAAGEDPEGATTDTGCSVAPGQPGSGLRLLAALAIAGCTLRRRRARGRAPSPSSRPHGRRGVAQMRAPTKTLR